jgi:cytochrome oxidase Cu insertion factor (SCO1/SenC/PrrC family)
MKRSHLIAFSVSVVAAFVFLLVIRTAASASDQCSELEYRVDSLESGRY